MKQWYNQKQNNTKIDSRDKADILREIETLSKSYVPEWKYDIDNPDIGSVIGMLYASQMMENIDKYNDSLRRFHVDFINMLGISLEPATPASAMVLMDVADESMEGVEAEKGLKLLAETDTVENEGKLIFETTDGIYVTNSKLTSMFMTSEKLGKIVPILGNFDEAEYAEKPVSPEDEEELLEEDFFEFLDFGNKKSCYPFKLFDFSVDGIEKHAVLLYHSHMFDVEDSDIYLRFKNQEEFTKDLIDGRYRLLYYTDEDFVPVDSISGIDKDTVAIRKSKPCKKTTVDGKEYSLFVIEAVENPEETVECENLYISAYGDKMNPEFVYNGQTDLEIEEFRPFGDTLGLFKELYIGHNEYFHKPGAKIKVNFKVRFDKTEVDLTKEEREEELKIIKRKPRIIQSPLPAETFPEEISIEYFNGRGYKRLECKNQYKKIFAEGKDLEYTLEFICPDDWEETTVGAESSRALRITLLKADNCYLRPCIHHIPVITSCKISFSYKSSFKQPEKVVGITGTKKRELTSCLFSDKPVTLFMKGYYNDTALYMGFDKKMENGPISILVCLEDDNNFQGVDLEYYYYSRKGFQRLKLVDHTNGLMNSNRLIFIPPSDMAMVELEGKKCYWIKASLPDSKLEDENVYKPVISAIEMNAVEAVNTETLPEEEYYIDDVAPNMMFSLYASNILDVDVWVNEAGQLTDSQMKKLLTESPDMVKVERNLQGRIQRFYVKWKEIDNFDDTKPEDRVFSVDRMNRILIFGDGVHVQIPRETRDVSFIVRLKTCSGKLGNVSPNQIYDTGNKALFIKNVRNPLRSFGGTDMETIDEALLRGSNIISSRNRLVSITDYEREILSYSSNIVQAKAINGLSIEGRKDDSLVSFVILLKDYLDNQHSFYRLQNKLKKHLLERCELSIAPDNIEIVPPQFVAISVEVWVEISNMDDTFEVQNEFRNSLDEFFNPYTDGGWEIGHLPTDAQIKLVIRSNRLKANIKHIVITASYNDMNGSHDVELRNLEVNPFMLCKSGKHKIHFATNS